MLFLHEVHQIVGRSEDEFESAFRDGWMAVLGETDDARLLTYAHQAYGVGRAYSVVTITAVRDGSSYERLARRIQTGDLRRWAAKVDRLRHSVRAKLLLPVPWSPLLEVDLGQVPTHDTHHPATLYMEDTVWPHRGRLDAYLVAARDNYLPSLAEGRHHGGRPMLRLDAVWQSAWGAHRRHEVVLWQRVVDAPRLLQLLTSEVPQELRMPGTWMHDALAVRDDWVTRLYRTTRWSPHF